jgi:hypothetical protein
VVIHSNNDKIKDNIKKYDYANIAHFMCLTIEEKINLDTTAEKGGPILHTLLN